MSSELRVNKLTSRSGVGTVTFNDSGLIITGIATAATLDITGNATIAGVLSYDDVTNVDSVGLVTARSGIKVGATGSNTLISGTATGIGIGTGSPDRKLEVVNDDDYALKVGGNTSGGYYLELGQTGTNGSAGIKYSGSGGSLKISNSSGEIARFDPSGNMGVGEETPDVRLHVTETINSAYSLTNVTTDANHLLKLENPSTTANAFAGIQFRTGNGADMYFGAIQQSANDGDFFFANQNSPNVEIMRIKSTGKIGIGTDNPAHKLDVLGTSVVANIKSTNNNYALQIAGNNCPYDVYVGSDDSNNFLLANENNDGTFTERLRVKSDGDVYIGNIAHSNDGGANSSYRTLTLTDTTNGAQLHLRGQSPKLFLDVTSSGNGEIYYDSGDLRILSGEPGTTSSEKVRITSAGNFGIGVTPNVKLHVKLDTNKHLYFQGNIGEIGNVPGIQGVTDAGSLASLGLRGNDLRFATGSAERMRIDTSGRVLINHTADTAPAGYASKLQLCDTSYQGSSMLLRRDENSDSSPTLIFAKTRSSSKGGSTVVQDGDSTGAIMFFGGDGNDANAQTAYILSSVDGTPGNNDMPGRLTFHTTADGATASTERVRIDSSGHLQIGATTSDSFRLKVLNGAGTLARFTDGTSQTLDIRQATGGIELQNPNNGFISFKGSSAERMRIDSSGRLLIGRQSSSNSNGLLQVARTSGPQLVIANTNASSAFVLFQNAVTGDSISDGLYVGADSSTGGYLWNYESGHIYFGTSNLERARISSAGYSKHNGGGGSYYSAGGTFHEFSTNNNSYVNVFYNTHASTPYGLFVKYSATPNNTGAEFLYCEDNAAARFAVRSNGGVVNYSGNNINLCDEREKKNIVSLDAKWDKVKSWDLKKFHYNEDDDTDDLRYGVIAQQVETTCPEVLTEWTKQKAEDAILDDDGNVVTPAKEEILRKGVKEQQMMWMAIKALQEAQTRIETLEAEVAALKAG